MNASKIVGIFVARLQDTAAELIRTLCEHLKNAGLSSLVFQSYTNFSDKDEFDCGERALLQLIPYHKLSALILFSETINDDGMLNTLANRAREANIPVITMQKPLANCHLVTYDIVTPFSELINHVLDHHHCRRVAFIAGIHGNPDSESRLSVYRKALAARDIPYEEGLVQYGNFWETPTIAAVRHLYEENKGKAPIEAIICANDTMAMTVISELSKYGYSVPNDVIVTGCDGIAHEKFFIPRLSTAACDYHAIGSALVDLLLRLRANPSLPIQILSIPYCTKISQSCGCHPVGNPNAAETLMNLSMQLNSLRAFHKEVHNMTIRLLDEELLPEQLGDYIANTGWGLARYQTSLVLFRNTLEGLGIFQELSETGKNAYEFCRWFADVVPLPLKPFSPRELLPNLDAMYDNLPSKAIIVTVLHEQTAVFGYFVTGFEPMDADYSFDSLDYGRLLDYQMALSHTFSTLMHRRSLQAMNTELEHLYVHDSMTGMFNRRGFFQRLNYLISQAEPQSSLFIAAIDMDGLKYINDTFGHAEGDAAIIAIANLISEIAPQGSAVARFGGDEFMIAVLLSDYDPTFPDRFRMAMEQSVEQLNKRMQKPYLIGASCGIEYCTYTEQTDIDELMKSADDKLYVDKASHKCLRSTKRKP